MAALLDTGILALGFGFGAATMLSVGPTSLLLIREGLAQGRMSTVATTVWISESAVLLSAFISSNVPQWIGPSTRVWLSWCGLAALIWFAVGALRSALLNKALGSDRHEEALHTCLKRAFAVVWCNPLTYLELFMIPAASARR